MSDAGDRLRRRYADLLLSAEVPELAGALGTEAIYFEPMTLRDEESLQRWIEEDTPEGWAEVVLRKALHEDRSLMFDRADKGVLMEAVEAAILRRVATVMMTSVSPEQASKNSGRIADDGRDTTSPTGSAKH